MNVIQLQQPEKRTRRTEPHYLPADFVLTPALRQWAVARGITKLDERLEHFTDLALAKSYKYADWEAAFRNACRGDWARLGGPVQGAAQDVCCTCANELHGSYTLTSKGKQCNKCWNAR